MVHGYYSTYSRSAIPTEICIPSERHVNDHDREKEEAEAWCDFSFNDTFGDSDSDSSNSLRLHQLAAPGNVLVRNNEIREQVGKQENELKPTPANGNPLGETSIPFNSVPLQQALTRAPVRNIEIGREEKLKPTPPNGNPFGETWLPVPVPQSFAWETNSIRGPAIQPDEVVGPRRDTESKCFGAIRVHVVTSTVKLPRSSTTESNFDKRACPERSVHLDEGAGAKPEIPWYCDQQQGKRWWVPGASYPGFPIHSKMEAMYHQVSKPVKASLSAMRTASEPVMVSLLAAKTVLMGPIQSCINGGQDPSTDDERSANMAFPKECNAERRRPAIANSSWNNERRDQLDSPMRSHNKPESIMRALHVISEWPHDTELFFDETPDASVSDCRRELRDECSNGSNLDVLSSMLEQDDWVPAGMWSELRDSGDRGLQHTRLDKWGPKFDEGVHVSHQLGPTMISSSALGSHLFSANGSDKDSVDTRRVDGRRGSF